MAGASGSRFDYEVLVSGVVMVASCARWALQAAAIVFAQHAKPCHQRMFRATVAGMENVAAGSYSELKLHGSACFDSETSTTVTKRGAHPSVH